MMLVGGDDRWWRADFSKTFGGARAPHAHRAAGRAASLLRPRGITLLRSLLPVRLWICVCLPSDEVLQLRLGAVSQAALVAAPLVCASLPAGLAHRRLAGSCCLGYLPGYLSVLAHSCTWAQPQAFRHVHARRPWLGGGCALLCELCQSLWPMLIWSGRTAAGDVDSGVTWWLLPPSS